MSKLPVHIDYALAMADGVGAAGGLTEAQLDAEGPAVERAICRVLDESKAGTLGFWTLPGERQALGAIDEWVSEHSGRFGDVLVLGIGGSSLGARAIDHALGGPPGLPGESDRARLHFPDNSDPWLLARLLERLDPAHTIAVVTSKSGGTIETAAQYLTVRAWLERALGPDEARSRLLLVTDPEKGPLRKLASDQGIKAFDVPPNVGGRFSVLSPVGLLPARLAGYDAVGLLDGAGEMAAACERIALRNNPAALLAALHVLHERLHRRSIHVLMPYSDALRPFAGWFVQLWAESLGKRHDRQGRVVECGPTPIPAVGATDQHAQVQLFMEGPRDKLITFIAVSKTSQDVSIPKEEGAFGYLGGHSMAELLDAERRGTTLALAEDGRPSVTIEVDALDSRSLGALFFLFEAATAFAGDLFGIDAFDQPGVELGKRLASGLLGRPGYEEAGGEVRQAEAGRSSHYRVD